MPGAVRLGDLHLCADDGPHNEATMTVVNGSPNITINGLPAARVGDVVSCRLSGTSAIAEGSSKVFFNGQAAARIGDKTSNSGSLMEGSSNVMIGDGHCKVSFGNTAKVSFGNQCKVYLSCGANSTTAGTPAPVAAYPPAQPTEPSLTKTGVSLSLDLLPAVGTVKGVVQTITGVDTVTGEPVDRKMEVIGVALSIIPGGKALVKCEKMEKAASKIWKELKAFKKSTKTNGLTGKKTRYYQWDHTHGDIEVYDSNEKHLGTMDPQTGEMIKPPVSGRDMGNY